MNLQLLCGLFVALFASASANYTCPPPGFSPFSCPCGCEHNLFYFSFLFVCFCLLCLFGWFSHKHAPLCLTLLHALVQLWNVQLSPPMF